MGISVWQLLIILAIVLVLFGAKRLRNLGGDLGTAVKGFRESIREGEENKAERNEHIDERPGHVIEGEVTSKEKNKA
ncbi:twin-arginine translocase TatA/TatE family subunit [Ectothiorhodospiraceae bacterium 2226]|nr:twin-arginine translocase TatA/TatE family subunit [Ectothiorhodospiraceae bacterium 2226]